MVPPNQEDGSSQEPARSSLAQQGVWITERAADVGSVYHVPLSIEFTGELNLPALLKACEAVTRRHPILTASVIEDRGVPSLRPGSSPCQPTVEDLSRSPQAARAQRLEARLRELILRPFDLAAGPLIRFTVFLLEPERAMLAVVGHHVGFDGQSKDILARDLAAYYRGYITGSQPELPALETTCHDLVDDHIARVEQLLPDAREFWSRRWRPPPDVALPGWRRPADHVTAGVSHEFTLEPALAERIAHTATRIGVSRFELLLTTYQTLLFRYGNPDAVIALDLGTRPSAATDHIGVFINEVLVNSEVSAAQPFSDAARKLRAQLRELYAFREVPVPRAVPAVKPGITLAPVSFSYRRRSAAPTFTGVSADVDWTMFNLGRRNALHVLIIESAEQTTVSLEHTDGAFPAAAVRRIGEHYQELLTGAVADSDTPLGRLPLLSPSERAQVVNGGDVAALAAAAPDRSTATANATRAAAARGGTALELFHDQVRRDPTAVALLCGDESLTYAQLAAHAGRLATALRQRGVGPGNVIALCGARSTTLVAAVLAIWKVGAAYLPLDGRHPDERLAFMLRDSSAALLLTDAAHGPRFASAGLAAETPTARLDLLLAGEASGSRSGPPPRDGSPTTDRCHATGLAYVIYTSGSTGVPKGVAVGHAPVVNLLTAMRQTLGRAPRSPQTWLAVTSLSFDISVLELFGPLASGGRAVLSRDADVMDGAALTGLIRRHAVTHVQATPTTWQLLLDAGLPDQPLVALCGGETLPPTLAEDLSRNVSTLWNVYGPTETTIWSTAWPVPPAAQPASRAHGAGDAAVSEKFREVRIGRPLANTRCHVLDDAGNPTPIGIAGELHIGGAGLAHGYLARAALTARQFIPDPYGPAGARLYRTGDRARWRADGVLEHLGRADGQVKVRGHRIELGDVEACLAADIRVSQAAATVREDRRGDRSLIAYAVLGDGQSATAEELRGALRRRLPEPSVPAAVVVLDAMPTTPNGKRDRAALAALATLAALPAPPRPEPGTPHPATAAAPAAEPSPDPTADQVTRSVRDIWQEVLDLDSIGVHDDLFDLGGHSLTVTQIASRIRKRLGVDLPLHMFYDCSTVAGLASAVAQAQPATSETRDPAVPRPAGAR